MKRKVWLTLKKVKSKKWKILSEWLKETDAKLASTNPYHKKIKH